MKTIAIRGMEHNTPHDALTELNFSGDRAIGVGGRVFTVRNNEFRRIEAEGVQPTTWHDRDGQIVSAPGRHG